MLFDSACAAHSADRQNCRAGIPACRGKIAALFRQTGTLALPGRNDQHRRVAHPPRIPVWLSYDQAIVYFITFCVQDRRPVLANDKAFAAFLDIAQCTSNWTILAAVLMPDHVHLLAAPSDRDTPVGALSATIKRAIRRNLRATWRWQSGCFDRLLRSDESADDKWHYIKDNPVRAGLVSDWSDWPYKIGFRAIGNDDSMPHIGEFGEL